MLIYVLFTSDREYYQLPRTGQRVHRPRVERHSEDGSRKRAISDQSLERSRLVSSNLPRARLRPTSGMPTHAGGHHLRKTLLLTTAASGLDAFGCRGGHV